MYRLGTPCTTVHDIHDVRCITRSKYIVFSINLQLTCLVSYPIPSFQAIVDHTRSILNTMSCPYCWMTHSIVQTPCKLESMFDTYSGIKQVTKCKVLHFESTCHLSTTYSSTSFISLLYSSLFLYISAEEQRSEANSTGCNDFSPTPRIGQNRLRHPKTNST